MSQINNQQQNNSIIDIKDYVDDLKKSIKAEDYIRPKIGAKNACSIVINTTFDQELLNSVVMIKAIKEYANADKFYDIYVLNYSEFKAEIIKSLEDMSAQNVRVKCLDWFCQQNYFAKKGNILFVPEFIKGYEKVLFLSASTIAMSDVAEIFETDLSEDIVACCQDIVDSSAETERYNTDVMLVNVANWQKYEITKKCCDNLNYKLTDLINLVCNGKIKKIAALWNIQYKTDKFNINSPLIKRSKGILNYIDLKPWISPQLYLADIWWKFARQTPVYELILYLNIHKQSYYEYNDDVLLTSENNKEFPALKNDSATEQSQNCISDVTQADFYNFVTTLHKDVETVMQKRIKNKQDIESVYLGKFIEDDSAYKLVKQYLKMYCRYLFSLNGKRSRIKEDMAALQLEIVKKMLK